MRTSQRTFRLDPSKYPVVVPHVSWSEGTLFFGGIALRELSPAEWAFLQRCDGTRALRELVTTASDARTIATVAPWLVWWDAPVVRTLVVPGGATRLVFSPGPEDAWLGMGGRLFMESPTHATTVITCFGLMARTVEPLAFATPNDLAAIARDEIALVAQVAGVAHELWELPARELRHSEDGRAGAPSSVDWMKSMLREVIDEAVARAAPNEIFVPFAGDASSDAGVLLDVVLGMYVDGLFDAAELHIFESTPVANGHRPIDEFLGRFERSYVELRDYFVPVTPWIGRKGSALEVFRSRVDHASRDAWLESAKLNGVLSDPVAGSGTTTRELHAERFWAARLAGAA